MNIVIDTFAQYIEKASKLGQLQMSPASEDNDMPKMEGDCPCGRKLYPFKMRIKGSYEWIIVPHCSRCIGGNFYKWDKHGIPSVEGMNKKGLPSGFANLLLWQKYHNPAYDPVMAKKKNYDVDQFIIKSGLQVFQHKMRKEGLTNTVLYKRTTGIL